MRGKRVPAPLLSNRCDSPRQDGPIAGSCWGPTRGRAVGQLSSGVCLGAGGPRTRSAMGMSPHGVPRAGGGAPRCPVLLNGALSSTAGAGGARGPQLLLTLLPLNVVINSLSRLALIPLPPKQLALMNIRPNSCKRLYICMDIYIYPPPSPSIYTGDHSCCYSSLQCRSDALSLWSLT